MPNEKLAIKLIVKGSGHFKAAGGGSGFAARTAHTLSVDVSGYKL